jgi:ComF family protein
MHHSGIFRKKNLSCHCAFYYKKNIKMAIHNLKFGKKLAFSQLLGELLHERMKEYYTDFPSILIPVPLHVKRLRDRGFNQALEIGKVIANKQSIKIDKYNLIRNKNTKPQAQISSHKRQQNISDAFSLKKELCYKRIILLDDVITTGNTIAECYHTLKPFVEKIDIWCIAKA